MELLDWTGLAFVLIGSTVLIVGGLRHLTGTTMVGWALSLMGWTCNLAYDAHQGSYGLVAVDLGLIALLSLGMASTQRERRREATARE